eukprot:scaffold4279_cov74-Skeletonema_dohrnii-CCMP3373.AAC.2
MEAKERIRPTFPKKQSAKKEVFSQEEGQPKASWDHRVFVTTSSSNIGCGINGAKDEYKDRESNPGPQPCPRSGTYFRQSARSCRFSYGKPASRLGPPSLAVT